jgi:NitT/TauT family transport system substrate-binding protein
LALAVGAVLGVLAFLARSPEPEPPLLRVGHARHDHHAALFVAATYPDRIRTNAGAHLVEREFAQDYDLVEGSQVLARLRVDASVGALGLIRRLAEDQLDLSFGGVPAMLVQIDGGAPIRILSPVMSDGAGLVVSDAILADSWTAFLDYVRNRTSPVRIGYKATLSVQNLVFEQRLSDAGIRYGKTLNASDAQIILVNVAGPENLIPALRHGLVDGFVSMQPYLSLAEVEGVGRLVSLISGMAGMAYPCCALAAREATIAERGEVLDVFVELMQAATAFLAQEPELSAEAVSAWLGTSPALERRSLPTTDFSMARDLAWEQGIERWHRQLREANRLHGTLAAISDRTALIERIYASPDGTQTEAADE